MPTIAGLVAAGHVVTTPTATDLLWCNQGTGSDRDKVITCAQIVEGGSGATLALLAAETAARTAADSALDGRVDTLEAAIHFVRIPDTGAAALKLSGATGAGSSADLDFTYGSSYTAGNGVLSLFSTFLVTVGSLVSSSREVTITLHNSDFGLLAAGALAPIGPGGLFPRYIPIRVAVASGVLNYHLRVYPPAVVGGDAYFVMCDATKTPVTYAALITAAGVATHIIVDVDFNTTLPAA